MNKGKKSNDKNSGNKKSPGKIAEALQENKLNYFKICNGLVVVLFPDVAVTKYIPEFN